VVGLTHTLRDVVTASDYLARDLCNQFTFGWSTDILQSCGGGW
jgi:hypothetical protein